MAQSNNPGPDGLQFETVEPIVGPAAAGGRPACVACKRPITDVYYTVGSGALCPDCRDRVMAPPAGRSVARLAKATLLGLGAGLVGAIGWFAIRRLTGYEIGLVAVVVGVMVGTAVRKGSGGRGGRGYQWLAVALTYCCICANYLPDVATAVFAAAGHRHTASASTAPAGTATSGRVRPAASNPAAVNPPPTNADAGWLAGLPKPVRLIAAVVVLGGLLLAGTLVVPVAAGAQNLIGLFIIGIAMWQAWKLNARRLPRITGPYGVAVGSVGPPALPEDVL